MIRLFTANRPVLIVLLFICCLIFNLVLFLKPVQFSLETIQAPLTRLLYFFTGSIFNNNHYVLSILSIVLVVGQALMVNHLVSKIKLFRKINYVPALIYILVSSLFSDFLYLSPALIANTFIVLIISGIFSIYKQQKDFAKIYDIGLLIGICALFYSPTFILLVLFYIALGMLRPFSWREWTIGLFGFLTPYFLAGTFLYLIGQLPSFFDGVISWSTLSVAKSINFDVPVRVIGTLMMILIGASVVMIQMNFLKSPIQIRKFVILLGWAIALLFVSAVFQYPITLSHFVILSVPLTIIISYYFVNVKKRVLAELYYMVLFLIVILFQYIPINS